MSYVYIVVKSPPASVGDLRDLGSIPWRRAWPPTPEFLPGESHGQRSLMGCNPWSHKKLDTIEHAYTMVVQHCIRMKCHGIMCFKMVKVVNFVLCLFYPN